ncbi:hypothetical protein [Pseudomonas sp. B19125]|uniref:hypothetical protein n=1 Tax=Pseudomonas sp. B19125 TaxID=3235109 RepID=UPI003783C32E
MTVIASYNHFGCGIVIGDILINGPVNEEKPPRTSLPTLGNMEDFFGGAWGIHKSSQKVCIVSDYCALAWAGSQLHARVFIMRISKLSKRIKITKRIIERIFVKCDSDEISIVGAIYENEKMQTFGFDCHKLECPTLGEVHYAGSGASVIEEYIGIVKEMALKEPKIDDICARGASLALTQVAHLLNAEFRKGSGAESIFEFFGGGYEIAAFYDGKFQKITSNFVFHNVNILNGFLKIGNPRLIISQTYSKDELRFQAVSPQGDYDDKIARHEMIEIPPLLNRATEPHNPSRNSRLNWACFVFVDNFKFLGNQLISLIIKSDTPPIEFSVIDDNFDFWYSEKAGKQIGDFLTDVYINN